MDIDTVFVLESCVGAFPRCDTSAAAAHEEIRIFDPERTEAVEKISLACDLAFGHVAVGELADIDGVLVGFEGAMVEARVRIGGR